MLIGPRIPRILLRIFPIELWSLKSLAIIELILSLSIRLFIKKLHSLVIY